MANSFRVNARQFSLTYPQVPDTHTKEDLYRFLDEQFSPHELIVAREEHKDGNQHFHVFLSFEQRRNIKNSRYFDWAGQHPNVQGCRSKVKWVQYLLKEDRSPLSNEEGTRAIESLPKQKRERDNGEYLDLARSGRTDAAIHSFSNTHPRLYAIHKRAVDTNLRDLAPIPATPYWPLTSFDFDERLWDRELTLVLSGKTNCGKTELAIALFNGKGLLVRHLDKLKAFQSNYHTGIIFDDMCFTTLSRENAIHLVDTYHESQINVKHSMVCIPARTPRIITTNMPDWRDIFPADPAGAIQRRVYWHSFSDDTIYDPMNNNHPEVIDISDDEEHSD